MRSEWFKVEVLQDYLGEDVGPSLDAWLVGNKQQSIKLMSADYPKWVANCRKKRLQGVQLIRIHVVEEPFTSYLDWEIHHYKLINVPKCGEKVYLINRSETTDLALPDGDVMIFDKKRVVVSAYDQSGRMAEQTFFDAENGDDIKHYLELRQALKDRARALQNFEHPKP